jgi:8-oxo-dGTP pyrophosphatase MutT (NUDIX family)
MKIPVCAGGFLIKKNKFLFGKRSEKKTWAPKMWDIVGGHSLKGEHPLDTLKRETFEEIGVTVLNARFMTSVDVLDEKEDEYFKYHIYMITSWKGKPANRSDEHTKICWFTRKKLGKVKIASEEYITLLDDWLNDDMVAEK